MRTGALGDILKDKLPKVVIPGGRVGLLCPKLAARLGMPTGKHFTQCESASPPFSRRGLLLV